MLGVGLELVSHNLPALVAVELEVGGSLPLDLLQQVQVELAGVGGVLWLNVGLQDRAPRKADRFGLDGGVGRGLGVESVLVLRAQGTARVLTLLAGCFLLREAGLALPAAGLHAPGRL